MPRKPENLPPLVQQLMEQNAITEIKTMADEMGVPRSTLSHLLHGTNDMPLETALSMLKVLRINDPQLAMDVFKDIVAHRKSQKRSRKANG